MRVLSNRWVPALAAAALAVITAAVGASGDARGEARNLALQERQIEAVRAAILKYSDISVARREGWRRSTADVPLMGEHWNHRKGPDYVSGDALDFARPSNLMYTEIDGETVLTGVAFVVRIAEDEPLPLGFAGPEDRWHVHNAQQVVDEALESRPLIRWFAQRFVNNRFDDDGVMRSRLAMVHVWVTLPNPDGPFADFNRTLPYRKLGLPLWYADGASVDAARGLHLATEKGCAESLDGHLWLADADRRQRRTLKDACRDMAETVRGALDQSPDVLNATAEDAWRFLDALIDSVCTPAQLSRIAALKENGH